MPCKCPSFFVPVLVAALAWSQARAADAPNAELDRLRLAVRDATLQSRAAQADAAAARAAQAAGEAQNKELATKYDALKKQTETDQSAAQKTIGDLNRQMATRTKENEQLTKELAIAKTEWAKAAQAARTAEAEGARLAAESAARQKRILNLQAKNVALFIVANEILTEFSDFSFGKALKAKEPFVGSARARLEMLVQDFHDRIADQRGKP